MRPGALLTRSRGLAATSSTLSPSQSDIKTLKLVMGALKTIKDDGTDLQFTLDQLNETLGYMETHKMGKLDPMVKKLADVRTSFENAQKDAPSTRKPPKSTPCARRSASFPSRERPPGRSSEGLFR